MGRRVGATLIGFAVTLALLLGNLPPSGAEDLPIDSVASQDDSAPLPDDTVTLPEDTVTLPDDTVTLPDNTVTLPDGSVTLPEDTVTSQDDTVTLPVGSVSLPSIVDGYIPMQFDSAVIDDATYTTQMANTGLTLSYAPLPSAYNLRDNSRRRLPGVRNQGQWGTCWAIAAAEAAESTLARNGVLRGPTTSARKQISPLHLVQGVYYTNTFKADTKHPLSAKGPYLIGGNPAMAATAWSHWYGAQKESKYPYPKKYTKAPKKISQSGLKTNAYHLLNWWLLPDTYTSDGTYSPSNVDVIKKAVHTYGAVATSLDMSNANVSKTGSQYYFYTPSFKLANHAVIIIGWNDSVSKSRFTRGSKTPAGNGAFLVQNSWGSKYTYLWVSYYDKSLANSSIFNLTSAKRTSTHHSAYSWTTQYAYDSLGWFGASMTTGASSTEFANRFTARSTSALRAVQFVTPQPNTSYTISVYLGADDNSDPTAGAEAAVISGTDTTISGQATYAGYQTVALHTPIKLVKGQKFSIVVEQSVTSGMAAVPVESRFVTPAGASVPTIYAGQSYVMDDSGWHDIVTAAPGQYGNVNVIGLVSPLPKYKLSFKANGGKVSKRGKTITYESKYGKLPIPKRHGYTFTGWYTSKTGDLRVTSQTVLTTTANKTVYAHWEKRL